ncbi:hypothetical protein [Microcoleus sp. B3-D7]|uniref:hypothetical protein n=1 Tax=Microcoleus sp. B3-D7 TaxID=2818659 RepID=UPI002FD3D61F
MANRSKFVRSTFNLICVRGILNISAAIVGSIGLSLSLPKWFGPHQPIYAEKNLSNLELILPNLYSNVFIV